VAPSSAPENRYKNLCALLPPPDSLLLAWGGAARKFKKRNKKRGGFKLDFLQVGGYRRLVDANPISFLNILDSFKLKWSSLASN
jgi:hypothetical protein